MNLSKYIAELLVKNNCVIVPNFGGFIANYKPAVIDELRHKIYPPSKRILFNSNLLSNDGLLANYVSIQISKSYAESLELIDEVSLEWKTKLNNGERVSIGEVGFIYEVDNKIQFEQDREFNLYLGAYGLSTVNFVPLTEEVVKTEVVNETPVVIEIGAVAHSVDLNVKKKEAVSIDLPTVMKRKKSNRWKYLAAACVLPVLFYSYWIPMETHYLNSGNIQMADFNPLQKKADKIYNTRFEKNEINDVEIESSLLDKTKISASNVKFYNYQFSDELYIPVDLKEKTVKIDKTEVVKVKTTVKKESKVVEKHFHLIAGCFGSEINANVLVDDLKSKGYRSTIIDKNKGLYRVAVQSFESKNSAIEFKSKLKSNSISSWLLTK
jgi:cell division septation protein DedD